MLLAFGLAPATRRVACSERKVELSIHDTVFGFIYSRVNIAINVVAKEKGVPTMRLRTAQTADFVGQRIIHILVELAFAREHHERSCWGQNGKDHEHPLEPRRWPQLCGTAEASARRLREAAR
jgi:hypothetical protein